MTDDVRDNEPVMVDDAIQRILDRLKTEIDWDARDAKVLEERAEAERQRRAGDARARREGLELGGFPLRAIEAVRDLAETPAVVRAKRFLENDRSAGKGLLVLSGGVGAGKSVAATWLARETSFKPVFMRAATFAASGRYDRETRERWQDARMLVLDDLGAEYADAKGSFLVDLDELLDLFYAERRLLVITTNLDAKGFKTRYGGDEGRIVSRIREAGVFADCGGHDLRKKPAASGRGGFE